MMKVWAHGLHSYYAVTDGPFEQRFVKEALVWSALHHPNILPLIGFHFDRDRLQGLLICPWQEEGNVMEYLVPRRHDMRLLFRLVCETPSFLESCSLAMVPILGNRHGRGTGLLAHKGPPGLPWRLEGCESAPMSYTIR